MQLHFHRRLLRTADKNHSAPCSLTIPARRSRLCLPELLFPLQTHRPVLSLSRRDCPPSRALWARSPALENPDASLFFGKPYRRLARNVCGIGSVVPHVGGPRKGYSDSVCRLSAPIGAGKLPRSRMRSTPDLGRACGTPAPQSRIRGTGSIEKLRRPLPCPPSSGTGQRTAGQA